MLMKLTPGISDLFKTTTSPSEHCRVPELESVRKKMTNCNIKFLASLYNGFNATDSYKTLRTNLDFKGTVFPNSFIKYQLQNKC
jgi:hypothetical protein